ncbi:MAG: hypothetical protein LBR30_02280 [Clostridioides sp.]|jgi:hypothetical protein|nr:hypothetical protein [Clostridioides sp.]
MTNIEGLIADIKTILALYDLPSSDFSWSEYDSKEDAVEEMQNILESVESGDYSVLRRLRTLLLPTGSIQEISIDSGWAQEYIIIGSRMEKLIDLIMSSSNSN